MDPDALDAALIRVVTLWNVYALPALLAAVAAGTLAAAGPGWADRRRAVRLLGATHLGLALWALTTVAAELWDYRTIGVFPSNPVTGLPGSLVSAAADLAVGLGLWRFRPGARRAAVALAAFRAAVAVWVVSWAWSYGALIDLTEWPRVAVARALPLFLLAALLAPGTARVFRRPRGEGEPVGSGTAGGIRPEGRPTPSSDPALGPRPVGHPVLVDHGPPVRPSDRVVALAARLFLVVLGSVVVTDAVDRAARAAAEVLGPG